MGRGEGFGEMIEIAIAVIIVIGILFIQENHYKFLENRRLLDKKIAASGQLEQLREEFDDYKKRVDVLSLKAGFKIWPKRD